jgi:hypothetical protein
MTASFLGSEEILARATALEHAGLPELVEGERIIQDVTQSRTVPSPPISALPETPDERNAIEGARR